MYLGGFRSFHSRLPIRIATLALIVAQPLSPARFAVGDDATSSSSSAKLDFYEVCGTVVDEKTCNLAANASVTADSQKFMYCQSACSSKQAKDKSMGLGILWGAVAAVCTGACVASMTGLGTQELVCIGVSAAGGVTTGIVEKDFAQAIMGLAGAAGSYMANRAVGDKMLNKDPAQIQAEKEGPADSVRPEKATDQPPGKEPKGKDIGACLAAASAGVQTFTRFKTMSDSEETLQSSLASAAASDSTGTSTTSTGTTSPSADGSGTDTSTSGGTTTTASTTGESSSSTGGSCTSSTTSGTIACAAATDGNLPSWVTSPKFEKEFENQTGTKLSDYLASNASDGRQVLGATMGSGLAMGQSAELGAILDNVARQIDPNAGGTSYAGGGRGGSGGERDKTADMMSSFMAQFGPQGAKGGSAGGPAREIAFSGQKGRDPNDPTWNIFERVSDRYHSVMNRVQAASAYRSGGYVTAPPAATRKIGGTKK